MKNTALPELDRDTIERLKERFPDLSDIDLPKLEAVGKSVGKSADETIDRLLGRSKAPVWPWVAVAVAVVAVIGAVAAYFTWLRQPMLEPTDSTASTYAEPTVTGIPEPQPEPTWSTSHQDDAIVGIPEA